MTAIDTAVAKAGGRRAFAQANPGLDERSVIVSISDGWFREVRLCYDLNYSPVACPIPLGPSDGTRIRLAPRGPATRSAVEIRTRKIAAKTRLRIGSSSEPSSTLERALTKRDSSFVRSVFSSSLVPLVRLLSR